MDEIEYRIKDLEVIEFPGDPEGAYVILFHGYGANARDLLPLSQIYN